MTTPSRGEPAVPGMGLFPDQNPHPILRMSEAGLLLYANSAAAPITESWGVEVGSAVPGAVAAALRAAARESPPGRVEAVSGRWTFDVLAIHVPDLDAYNLYGTEITAAKVLERFPDRNPNPVLRLTSEGRLEYGNEASTPIQRALGAKVGNPISPPVLEDLRTALADPQGSPVEVSGEGRTFRLVPIHVPEFDFINVYGTDVTAIRALDKFPNQNPNPVLRLTRDGRLTYANPASEPVCAALGATVGDQLDPKVFARLIAACEDPHDQTIEIKAGSQIFRLRVVGVLEFNSINVYGTDITAVRQVEALSEANETLLLNILPASIAERLRDGEMVIADRFDDMAVLFADVVGFTELSARLEPTAVVELLNEVFSMCDRLADRFGLEKIKTVGDAYMVVGGLDHDAHDGADAHRASHAEDVADMGLAMLDELARDERMASVGLQVRVGMHIGPAVAGVIGLKKFIYDVWGDTVNTASRMESTGVPGRLQVARETYERLADTFELESRGTIDVKGKGPIETWFLIRRREAR